MKNTFITFYGILEESLKGKKVRLRAYNGPYTTLPDHDWFKHDEADNETGWSEQISYTEWTGVVDRILFNDNSNVDIIFDKTKPHTCSDADSYKDCFNWHMGDYIEIIDTKTD